MKKEQISDALNMLDNEIIEETDKLRNHKKGRKKNRGTWAAAAACLALAAYAGIRTLPQQSPELPQASTESGNIPVETPGHFTQAPVSPTDLPASPTDTPSQSPDAPVSPTETPVDSAHMPELPLLPVAGDSGTGMGYEGYLAYNVSELVSGNPWSETMELSALPVYQNRLSLGYRYIASGVEYDNVDFNEVQELLLEIAQRLELDTSSLVITDNAPTEEDRPEIIEKYGEDIPEGYFNPTALIIQTDGMEIMVDQALSARIVFDPPVALPDEYSFTHYASYEDCIRVAEYLKKEYSHLIGMDDPQISIDGGDYNIYSQQSYGIYFYEADSDDTNRILNYNFRTIEFCCDDDGKLFLIWIRHPDLSMKVGDYPIITADKAKELLSAGNYLTTVPYEMPGISYVKKAELIYRTSWRNQYFMPYYRFYVEIPDADYPRELANNGIKTYGAYYVPAVDSRYLTEMPLWDGEFN